MLLWFAPTNFFFLIGDTEAEPFGVTKDVMKLFGVRCYKEDGDVYFVEEDDNQSVASDYDDPALLQESQFYNWDESWNELEMSEAKLKVNRLFSTHFSLGNWCF